MNKERMIALIAVIFVAAVSRLLPHPQNVAPIAALALFGGAMFERKSLAFIVPGLALLLSDLIIGFYEQMWVTYLGFAAVVVIGLMLQGRIKPLSVAAASVSGSLLFFLITNCALWAGHDLYPKTMEGVMAGYVAALPFLWNSLAGDLFYSALLFGGFALAEKRFRMLRPAVA